jgi:hypothetical protein
MNYDPSWVMSQNMLFHVFVGIRVTRDKALGVVALGVGTT